jgi:hypothetical protein
MKPMDHAEAHERIADLSLEPRRLAALDASDATDDAALRAHIESCPRCQAELTEWREFHAATEAALATNRREQLDPIAPPDDLRRRVLAIAHAEPRTTSKPVDIVQIHPRRPLTGGALLALAAVFALVAVGVGVLAARDQSARLDTTLIESRWLSDTVAALSRVLATPDHHAITLRTADGTGAGAIAWSRHDLVVISHGLPAPGADQVYRCWLDYEGTETAMGRMWFVDGDAFWVGSTQDWAAIDLDPEKQFLVTLEPTTNQAGRHTGPVVLQANLGG